MDNRRAIGKAVLLALCWFLSFAAFFIPLGRLQRFSLFLQVYVPIMLIAGYMALWRIPGIFVKWRLWIAAGVFAAVTTFGASFEAVGTAELVTTQIGRAFLYFLGRVPAFYTGMALLAEAMRKGKPLRRRFPAWVYALLIFIFWVPYLAALWPGSVSVEAVPMLASISVGSVPEPLLAAGFVRFAAVVGQGIFASTNAAVALYVLCAVAIDGVAAGVYGVPDCNQRYTFVAYAILPPVFCVVPDLPTVCIYSRQRYRLCAGSAMDGYCALATGVQPKASTLGCNLPVYKRCAVYAAAQLGRVGCGGIGRSAAHRGDCQAQCQLAQCGV